MWGKMADGPRYLLSPSSFGPTYFELSIPNRVIFGDDGGGTAADGDDEYDCEGPARHNNDFGNDSDGFPLRLRLWRSKLHRIEREDCKQVQGEGLQEKLKQGPAAVPYDVFVRMSLDRVEVTQEVLLAVLSHAHSTEAEEVMGLLLGDITDDSSTGGAVVCRVSLAFPQIRTDRRKDRVETSPEQMARCSAHAERLSRETGLRTRVVGWYHSHPHITVLPSHVDVRTQAMYQLLDPGFVGLIVSTFNRDAASQTSTVQLLTFPSLFAHMLINRLSFMPTQRQLTAFQSLPDGAIVPVAGGVGAGAGNSDGSSSSSGGGLVRSIVHSPTGPLVRKEVRVSVVPSVTSLERSFSDLLVVQKILLMEENELTEVHHAGVYQAHLVRLVETSLRPALVSVAALVAQQRAQEQQLRAQLSDADKALLRFIFSGNTSFWSKPAVAIRIGFGTAPWRCVNRCQTQYFPTLADCAPDCTSQVYCTATGTVPAYSWSIPCCALSLFDQTSAYDTFPAPAQPWCSTYPPWYFEDVYFSDSFTTNAVLPDRSGPNGTTFDL
ncbi:hypothetical protein VOLCADRAFT_106618 [Volvox carteri f. nagariensis]|uniref:MPN domain-containing protein n=1 Tax=Volvox carteri f. nagariensis TaxID=3068 RepID=D8U8N7_VOLCA|nr:uncharacterized protein VOLCADRAFT_106618 [Volvox carteri f. nagariensis]EFJ44015.1 hypothetical protein VOLCADRAFT_106618 [Volvox carteri f. nagariensis]|eukprot:XP_002955027.1 hypothetical protein VOLCADRAFT_106618 [Volvox carteri f. nagariensis]